MATAVVAESHGEDVTFLRVSWPTFGAIVADVGDDSRTRLAFDGEILELMAPLNDHEAYTRLLDALLGVLMSEWDVNLYCTGSATLLAEPVGAEPDTSYYIAHAKDIDGLERIDLRTSPPPDLVVEVDLSQRRLDKFALYASLGVPEFWRYNRSGLKAFPLSEDRYAESATSLVIPGLPIAIVRTFLERRLESDRRKVLKDWKVWLRANR